MGTLANSECWCRSGALQRAEVTGPHSQIALLKVWQVEGGDLANAVLTPLRWRWFIYLFYIFIKTFNFLVCFCCRTAEKWLTKLVKHCCEGQGAEVWYWIWRRVPDLDQMHKHMCGSVLLQIVFVRDKSHNVKLLLTSVSLKRACFYPAMREITSSVLTTTMKKMVSKWINKWISSFFSSVYSLANDVTSGRKSIRAGEQNSTPPILSSPRGGSCSAPRCWKPFNSYVPALI